MRWFLVLCVAAALATGVCGDCDACLDGRCYNQHIMPGGVPRRSADINRNNNTLYFIKYPSEDRIRECSLGTEICYEYKVGHKVDNIVVDQRTGDIYGHSYWHHGIYKYDLGNNEEHLVVPDARASDIQFKDKLYYVVSHKGIYSFENGVSRIVPETKGYDVRSFVVDNKDDIYFRSLVGKQRITRRLSKGVFHHDDFLDTVAFVTLDKDGNAIFFNHTDPSFAVTHVYRKVDGELVEVGAMNGSPLRDRRPLFDRDNNLVCSFSKKKPLIHLKKESEVLCKVENNRIITKTEESIEEFTEESTPWIPAKSSTTDESNQWITAGSYTWISEESSTTEESNQWTTAESYTWIPEESSTTEESNQWIAAESYTWIPEESYTNSSPKVSGAGNGTHDNNKKTKQAGSAHGCKCPKLAKIIVKIEFN